MCTENCCNHTRHAIFFFFLLSFLLLANTDHVFKFHGNKGDGDGGAGSSPPLCTTTATTTKLTLTFLYGALFTLILTILTNNSGLLSSPKYIEIPDSQRARRAQFDVGFSRTLTMGHPTVDYYDGGDGNEGGIGFFLLRTFPAFAYSVMRPQRMGKGCKVCVICQYKFKDGEMVRWLPDCDHLFHVCCVDEWLSSHKTCPCCRAVLDFTTSPTITSFNDQDHYYLDYFNEYY